MKKKKLHLDEMPEGYLCPLCPDHNDDEFVYCDVLDAYVCTGCEWDIAFALGSDEKIRRLTGWEGPDENQTLIERLETVSGKSLDQLRQIYRKQLCILNQAIFIQVNGGEE